MSRNGRAYLSFFSSTAYRGNNYLYLPLLPKYFKSHQAAKPLPDEAAGQTWLGHEPDLLFIAKANLRRLEEGLVRGPADLVVEIVSPESEWRDRQDKFRENAAGGVPEYWLIGPEQQKAEFYWLDDRHHYQSQVLAGSGSNRTVSGVTLCPVIPQFSKQPAASRTGSTWTGGFTIRESFRPVSESVALEGGLPAFEFKPGKNCEPSDALLVFPVVLPADPSHH